jgi:hypothetical protein
MFELTWHTGTLFLPLEHTTTQVWPGNDFKNQFWPKFTDKISFN